MTDDLISRDDLSRRMYHEVFEVDNGMNRWDSGLWIRYKIFENVIKEVPAVEPERKIGKWIKVGHFGRSYKCNQCGNYLDFDGVNSGRGDANYCPNCGAEMRERRDDG